MDHYRSGLAGMKRLPNGGGLFKTASRELARVVLNVTRIVVDAAVMSRKTLGICTALRLLLEV